jgi:hypothetical protein
MSPLKLLYRGTIPTLKKRLQSGADPNVSEAGESLLYCAIDREKWSLVPLSLSCGASPNPPGYAQGANASQCAIGRKTALMAAAYGGHREAVDLLLKSGANLLTEVIPGECVSDRRTSDAVDFAAEGGRRDLANYLRGLRDKLRSARDKSLEKMSPAKNRKTRSNSKGAAPRRKKRPVQKRKASRPVRRA